MFLLNFSISYAMQFFFVVDGGGEGLMPSKAETTRLIDGGVYGAQQIQSGHISSFSHSSTLSSPAGAGPPPFLSGDVERQSWRVRFFGVDQPVNYDRWTALRILYASVTMASMILFVRLWGQMMPTHSFYYSFSWAFWFIPYFGVSTYVQRRWNGVERCEMDEWWPTVKQSAVIGLTYAINYWGVSSSTAYVSGPAQVVATQVPIVLSAILSTAFVGRRFPYVSWFGILCTIGGGIAQVLGPSSSDASGSFSVKWFFIFVIGNIPSAAWTVTLEGFFKFRGKRDGRCCLVPERLMWSNVALMAWLVAFIPLFGAVGQPPLDDFAHNFRAAAACTWTASGGFEGDDCFNAAIILPLSIVSAVLQQHAQVLLAKHDTGMIATLVCNLAPFLADPIFASTAILGRYASTPSSWDAVAAVMCFVGAMFFALGDARRSGRDTQEEVNGSAFVRFFAAPWGVKWSDYTAGGSSCEDSTDGDVSQVSGSEVE